ncbi:MAG: hypothetical protein P4L55_07975 [Syntrophobacteraceae bacterium]|nr:hypothetical protein [Syntrophobacteraceae bacterium]
MQTESIREQARRLLDSLPDSATREDLMHLIYVRQAIEAGRKVSETVDVKEVRKGSVCRNDGALNAKRAR